MSVLFVLIFIASSISFSFTINLDITTVNRIEKLANDYVNLHLVEELSNAANELFRPALNNTQANKNCIRTKLHAFRSIIFFNLVFPL